MIRPTKSIKSCKSCLKGFYLKNESIPYSKKHEERKMKKIAIITLAIFTAVTVSSAIAADQKKSDATMVWSAKATGKDYVIGVGDVLSIVTWKEADFTRDDVLVRTDGKISFPLLNDVQAAGLTPVELKRVLEKGLKDYVSTPVVTVHVTNPGSQRIYILGEVMHTGEYPLVKNLTVLQAFALAGGFTE
jgi:protein involved in polysaccharide export with SLBB domain